MNPSFNTIRSTIIVTACLALLPHAQAGIKTWNGSASSFWGANGNWDGNIAPVNGDDLKFPEGPANLATTNSLGLNPNSISLGGSNYTIAGTAFSITNGLSMDAPVGTSNTVVSSITARKPQTWFVAAKNVLLFQSAVNLDPNTVTFGVDGELHLNAGGSGTTATLIKTNDGVLRLKATTTLKNVSVTGGTLDVDGTLVLTSGLALATGTLLSGTGTLSAFSCSGTVQPAGGQPGVLSLDAVTGTSVFNSGSTFAVTLNGTNAGTTYAQLKTAIPPTLSGASLQISRGYAPAFGDTFVIITNTGGSAFTSTFSGLAEGATQTVTSVSYRVSYVGGNGNDVTLTVVG
ncbi:MAG TPA: hypothetical protein VLT36_00240, partial [Candidatus Dormibacteraeota bacterium]|nr:hypothetical protein [Candidatus Dormibacteraeota bacterium]